MRAMFYNVKGTGHVNPALPLVGGLVARGHEVTYTLTSEWKDRVICENSIGRFRPPCARRSAGARQGAPDRRSVRAG